jgi:hypothetical protein
MFDNDHPLGTSTRASHALQGSQVYAVLAKDYEDLRSTPDSVLRVSMKGLRDGAIGHVVFKAAHNTITNILIIP